MKNHLRFFLAILIAAAFGACSKLQNNALAPVQSTGDIHPAGWTLITSPNFHGKYIKTNKYDLSTCESCHGTDLKGGMTQKSCYKCHDGASGPLSCNTCHGSNLNPAPPSDLAGDTLTSAAGVGAHQSHLAGSDFLSSVQCSSCHIVPQSAAPGVHPAGTGKALIVFSNVAVTQTNTPGSRFYDSTIATIRPVPSFNPQTLQCSNTYCHGNFKGGNNFTPTWTSVGMNQDACGTCHGTASNPAPSTSIHEGAVYQGPSSQNCYFCHEPMMGPNGIQDSSMHVTGQLTLYGRQVSEW